jgi:hypothetical protein
MTYPIERRWHRVAIRAAACALLVLVGGGGLRKARAEGEQRVLLMAPAEAELTARILGQTRDLGVTLEVADGSPPAGREAASAAGRAHKAAIVVWPAAHGAAGLDLHVLEVETGELRTRRVSTPERETLASSTTAEMAALVVRSELSALLSELRAKRESAPVPSVNTREVAAPPSKIENQTPLSAPPSPAIDEPGWRLLLAYRPSRPFRSTFAHALALGLRRDLSGFAFGATTIASLPLTVGRAGTEIRLNRLQLRLEGQKYWDVRPDLRFALGVAAGLSIDFRSTRKVAEDMVRTGNATTFSGSFGLLAQLDWLFSQRVGATLGLGADAVPWRTKFVYDDGAAGGQVARLSWLDIWGLVGFFTRFGA